MRLPRQWSVNELCRCSYNGIGPELIYVVTKITNGKILTIRPVYEFCGSNVSASHFAKRTRTTHQDACTFVDLVTLAQERQNLDAFINSRIQSLSTSSLE